MVSQYPRSPKSSVILYGESLYTCREMISEFEFFMYFMDEIVTLKIFVNWSQFKVRHIEMLSVLIFVVLMNLFDRELVNVSGEWLKMFSFFFIDGAKF